MPSDAPAIKLRHTAYHGARIVTFDRQREDREAIAFGLAEAEGLSVVPSFDDPFVIAGQGTAGLEMRSQLAALDLRADRLLVCTGGGGMMAGCALAFEGTGTRLQRWNRRALRIMRVLPRGAESSSASKPRLGLRCASTPTPGSLTFAIKQPRVASGLVVTQAEVHEAMRFAFEHLALVLEPGGAVCLAALLAKAVPVTGDGATTLSGGNVDPGPYAEILQG